MRSSMTPALPVLLLAASLPAALSPLPDAPSRPPRSLPAPRTLDMVLHVHPTPDEVGAAVGALILERSQAAIAASGRFTLALSGGSLPKIMNKGLAQIQGDVDYAKWFVFFADERCVPLDSDDSNFKACKEALFDYVSGGLAGRVVAARRLTSCASRRVPCAWRADPRPARANLHHRRVALARRHGRGLHQQARNGLGSPGARSRRGGSRIGVESNV